MSGDPQRGRRVVRVRLLRIGRFFGVPLYFAPSWLIIAALLTVSYGPVVAARRRPASSASSAYLLAFGYTVLFALCVLAHELGHTAVSLLLRHPGQARRDLPARRRLRDRDASPSARATSS